MSVKARNFTAGMINRCHPLSEICYDVTPAGLAVQCPGLPHLPLLARPVSAVPFPLPHHPADIFIQFYIRIDMRSRCCWRHFSFAVLWHEGMQKYILSVHGSHFYAIKHSERLEGGSGCPKLSCLRSIGELVSATSWTSDLIWDSQSYSELSHHHMFQ